MRVYRNPNPSNLVENIPIRSSTWKDGEKGIVCVSPDLNLFRLGILVHITTYVVALMETLKQVQLALSAFH